jgi:hypothetical protein
MKSPRYLQAQLKTAQAHAKPKFLIELAKPPQRKIVFNPESFRDPTLQKNKKTPPTPALSLSKGPNTDIQIITRTMTAKTQSYSDFQTRWTRTPAGNSVLPQLAVKCKIEAECYYQTFVLGDSEVLRNRQLRQHANR